MKPDRLILASDVDYSMNCYETKVNNNVLVVGTSGAGKTRSIVIPNILEASGSYIVSDPKGNLYQQYSSYLKKKGYRVKKLDFTDPTNSARYNFFEYIRNTQDINKVAHMIVYSGGNAGFKSDPFWDEAAELLLQSLIAYLIEEWSCEDQNIKCIHKLLDAAEMSGDYENEKSALDFLMEAAYEKNKNSYAYRQYKKFRVSASKTLRSIIISLNSRIGSYDTEEIQQLTAADDVDIADIGRRKTAVFVVVSDTDRSLDGLVNLFFTQAMHELCRYADKECENFTLPVPVRFILDDFATNCKIAEFPRMIASIRSRGISAMLMVQSEAQLEEGYGEDGRTIIGNCDTYVYLGGNDVETAMSVARRCDVPLKKVLNMPVETNWIFRRGQEPINARNFELEPFLEEVMERER